MEAQQLSLFPDQAPVTVRPRPGLTAESPLTAAVARFEHHMLRQDYAENTVKSFLGDLRILKRYLQGDPSIGAIDTPKLEGFLHWLQHERGKPCSPKSYARRLTTLKVFFAWLADLGVLRADPAAPLIHKPAKTPLPRVLYDEQVDRVLAVTRKRMAGDEPDPRPHLLVTLLLHTGIKKQEALQLKLSRIDTSDPAGPVIHVRYDRPGMSYKERRLRLPPAWARTLAAYGRVYELEDVLFPWTGRNLEYVLTGVAKEASLSDGLTFEMLRWTCAMRDFREGMDPERLRRKLGLSRMSWQETEPRLAKLSAPPL
ncbi:MAG: site-specific integrase [Anaerolineae bacterium]|jgi:integrase/recombinase XerD